MMTRESIIRCLKSNVQNQITCNPSAKCVRIRTRLCELRDFVYTIENNTLCCYLLDEDGMHGDAAENLTDGQLLIFADELMSMAERAFRRNYQSTRAREIGKVREDMRKVLTH